MLLFFSRLNTWLCKEHTPDEGAKPRKYTKLGTEPSLEGGKLPYHRAVQGHDQTRFHT